MATWRPNVTKKLSYRLEVPPGQEEAAVLATAQHWQGFTWETGRTIVEWVSQHHGNIQVWAIDEAEGRGVVAHCLAHMGVGESEGYWVVSESKNPRFGKIATVRATVAAVRNGSSGAAPHTYMIDGEV